MCICQVLPEVKVQVEGQAAARAAARAAAVKAAAREEAAAAVSVQVPAGSASAWPAVKKCHTNRVFPASKSSVPDAGP
ncbi:MAG: hypothetical protein ACOZF2_08940 [Thermodesulfobacteriota bacterium]